MSSSTLRHFIFIGAPASGKGSFGKKIAQTLGLQHFSLGEVIRDEVTQATTLGQQVRPIVEKGELISDSLATEIAIHYLLGPMTGNDGTITATEQTTNKERTNNRQATILDGFPRTVSQALALHDSLPHDEFVAIHIILEKWVAVEKTLGRRICTTCKQSFNVADVLTQGYHMPAILPSINTCPLWATSGCVPQLISRIDDTREIAERRYQEYMVKTTPLLDFYEKRNQLRTFQIQKGLSDTDKLINVMLS